MFEGIFLYVLLPLLLIVAGGSLLFGLLAFLWKIIRGIFSRKSKKKKRTASGYESFVASYLKQQGYHRVAVTQASRDFGVDVTCRKGFRKYAVQCKYYTGPVGVKAVQEIVAGKKHYGCNSTMIVTNSSFTKQAIMLAKENKVLLVPNVY